MSDSAELKVVRSALASYLRRYPHLWRLRRRDYLVPLDFHLARRQITLQGELTSDLYAAFREEAGLTDVLGLEAGATATIYLPFAVFPKRVLLDFTTLDSSGGRIPLLTRDESSRASATHLLGLWPPEAYPEPTSVEARGAHLILRVLAAIEPTALGRRVELWARREAAAAARLPDFMSRRRVQRRNRVESLDLETLMASWLEEELQAFSPGLASKSGSLIPALADALRGFPVVSFHDYLQLGHDQSDPRRMLPFENLAELIMFGVRDAARIVAEDQRAPGRKFETPRNAIIAEELEALLPLGLSTLTELLSAVPVGVPRAAARKELSYAAIAWMAHLVVQVRLDEPFHFRTSEILPFRREGFLPRQKLRWSTYQVYRVAPTDARSNHIEIATEDPELVIDCDDGIAVTGRGVNRPEEIFGQEYSESLAIAHFHSAVLATEQPFRKAETVAIYVRFKLPIAVKVGYSLSVGAVGALATWATYERFYHPDEATVEVFVVAAAFVVLLTFLMNIQHKPIVHGKLEGHRVIIQVAIAVLVVVPFVAWLTGH